MKVACENFPSHAPRAIRVIGKVNSGSHSIKKEHSAFIPERGGINQSSPILVVISGNDNCRILFLAGGGPEVLVCL